MPNLELEKKRDVSSFRRIAIGTWRTAYDPSVYGCLNVRMDEALRYIEAFRQATGRKLTVTHMVGKAVAHMLERAPDANAILRFNRIYRRKRVGVFFQVALEDPHSGELDLSGCTLFDLEKKSLVELVDEFTERTTKVKRCEDEVLENTRSTFKKIPFLLLNLVLRIISFFAYTLNLNLSKLGVPQDAFGSVMVTNIGSLKLDEAYVPLVPYSRVPLLLAPGAVVDGPVVEDGALRVGKVMRLTATFDHRVLDGSHAATMAPILRSHLEQPFEHFDPLPPAEPAAAGKAAEHQEPSPAT